MYGNTNGDQATLYSGGNSSDVRILVMTRQPYGGVNPIAIYRNTSGDKAPQVLATLAMYGNPSDGLMARQPKRCTETLVVAKQL